MYIQTNACTYGTDPISPSTTLLCEGIIIADYYVGRILTRDNGSLCIANLENIKIYGPILEITFEILIG